MVNYSKIKVLELKQDLVDIGLSKETIGSLSKKELIDLHKQNTSLLDHVNLDEEFEEVENEVYERQANSKGDFMNRGEKRILPIKYTPDFIGENFIIECKGRPNESFPIRWKMFKKYEKAMLPHVTLYKPQNQKECDQVIGLIIKNKLNEK